MSKKQAAQIAKLGRFGDDKLLHVSDAEIVGIERLIGRKLPTNPRTGAKEAFFFLPFLAGLGSMFGAMAPVAAAAPAAGAAAGLGTLGAGIATGMGAAGTAGLASGLGAAGAAGAASAIPAAASQLAATTIPAAATSAAIPAAATTAATTAAPTAATLTGGSGISSLIGAGGSLPATTAMSAETAAANAAAAAPAAAGTPVGPFAGGAGAAPYTPSVAASPIKAAPATTAMSPESAAAAQGTIMGGASGAVAPAAAGAGTGGGLAGLGIDPTMLMMAASMMGGMGGGGGDDDEGDAKAEAGAASPYSGGEPTFPDDGYDPGNDAEHDYFPKYGKGGMVKNCYGIGGLVANPLYGQDQDDMFVLPTGGYDPGIDKEHDYFQTPTAPGGGGVGIGGFDQGKVDTLQGKIDQLTEQAFGYAKADTRNGFNGPLIRANRRLQEMHGELAGLKALAPKTAAPMVQGGGGGPAPAPKVKKFAAGGQVGLAALPGAQAAQVMGTPPTASLGEAPEPGAVATSPYPTQQVGAETENDKELIAQTVQAIKGQHPNPNNVLMAFVNVFGEEALQDLVARVKMLDTKASIGRNDGQSDGVPAMIDGREPAALSSGEFVIPADVVSGLGNGDTQSGAEHLNAMMDRVRHARGGKKAQPKPIDAASMLPV